VGESSVLEHKNGHISETHPNKSPLNFSEKRERGRIQGLPTFFQYPYYLRNACKATNFKFCKHIHRIDWYKSPLKISGKVALAILRDFQKLSEQSASPSHLLCDTSYSFLVISFFSLSKIDGNWKVGMD